jgi:hypothetical protein
MFLDVHKNIQKNVWKYMSQYGHHGGDQHWGRVDKGGYHPVSVLKFYHTNMQIN